MADVHSENFQVEDVEHLVVLARHAMDASEGLA